LNGFVMYCGLHRRVRGDHDDRQRAVVLFQRPGGLDAVHARHHQIDDRAVVRLRLDEFEPFLAGGCDIDLEALFVQKVGERLLHDRLVIDDENGLRVRQILSRDCRHPTQLAACWE